MSLTGDTALEGARNLKNQIVTDAEDGQNDDMVPIVTFRREGEDLAIFFANQVDRDLALFAIAIGVPGYGCDEIVLATDAHYTRNPINPKTGERWGPNEMQQACDVDGACSLGIITDYIPVIRAYRDGRFDQTILPYHVDHDAHEIHWHEPQETESDVEVQGYIPDLIREAFAKPTLNSVIDETDDLAFMREMREDIEHVQVHQDAAVTRYILPAGQVLYMAKSEREREIINGVLDVENQVDLLMLREALRAS